MNGIQTVEGTLTGIGSNHGTTVTYRLDDDPPVDGRTIVIPDGYSDREKERIRLALCQADEPGEEPDGTRLTDGMAYMAVLRMLRDDCACTQTQAGELYTAWVNRLCGQAIRDWVDGLPEREATRLHARHLDRDGAGHPIGRDDPHA